MIQRPYVLVSGDFVKTGGMDRANHALASYLARQGREVHLVAYRVDDELINLPGVTWHRVPKPLNSYSLGRPWLDRRGRAWASRLNPRGARVVVNGGNCRWGDVNWVHHLNRLDPPGDGLSRIRRLKGAFDHQAHVAREREALDRARLVVTTCDRNRRDLLEHFAISDDQIRVAYYGTDPATFRPASPVEQATIRQALGWPLDRSVFLFVGALGGDRRKGFDTLYRAWATLCLDPAWNALLVVVGTGVDRGYWEGRTLADGLTRRIGFLGFRDDVPTLLRGADAHVLPSRYEGYSLITQEALCSGLLAYVTTRSGIAERYPADLAGLLIADSDDADALAAQLRGWASLRQTLEPSLRRFAERLRSETWDQMAERFVGFLDESN